MVAKTEWCYVIARADKWGGLSFRVAKRKPTLQLNEFALELIIKVPDSFWAKVYSQNIELAGDGGLTPEVMFRVRDASGKFIALPEGRPDARS